MFTFPLILTIYAGFTHAFEADHLLAVSNIVSRRNQVWSSMKDGIFWGLGHSSTIFLIGILMIIFKVSISEHSFHYFEATVGIMLITLAIFRFVKFIRGKKLVIHTHKHAHAPFAQPKGPLALATEHEHRHIHFVPKNNVSHMHAAVHAHSHSHGHSHMHSHKLAYGVGLIHGLAGSGALVVLVMAQIKKPLDGLVYLLIFCMGCVGGMLVAAGLFSIPFSKRVIQAPALQSLLIIATCVLSLVYGGKVIYDNVMLF